MGRISVGTGLISGIDTDSIISQLLALDARPRDALQATLDADKQKKTVLLALSTTLLALQGSAAALKSDAVLKARTAVSNQSSVLSVAASNAASIGSFQVRAVRQAQAQSLVSTGWSDTTTTAVGAGTMTLYRGGFVQAAAPLAALNGGAGVKLGSIRITDRTGAASIVDLSAAQNINDVLTAINSQTGIRVQASVSGDGLVITDQTGAAASDLIVANVGGGTTATGLGIAGSSSTATLTGTDISYLGSALRLDLLNDGNGVRVKASADDLRITAKNGATIDVNLSSAKTLGDVVSLINSDSQNTGAIVTASLSGDSLVLTDSSGGGGTLNVAALNASLAAADLGILGNEQGGGVLSGQRVLAALNSVLLKDLRGGDWSITPGEIQFIDRTGDSGTIDLTSARSLSEVISAINNSGLAVSAAVNAAGNGITVTGTAGSLGLDISDVSGNLATKLGIVALAAEGKSAVASGSLDLRYISENTRLSTLNGGGGVSKSSFRITDSTGNSKLVSLASSSINTVGDVLQAINTSGVGALATINATGDGILLTDTAGGAGTLTVAESGSTTAHDLNLFKTASGATIDGAYRYSVTLTSSDTLQSTVTKFKNAGVPVNASITNDGSAANPFHLVLTSSRSGAASRFVLDTGTTGLNFNTLSEGTDALLQVGDVTNGGLLLASSTNTFTNVLNGVNVTLQGTSATPALVTVSDNSGELQTAINFFVDNFNKTASAIRSVTSFDTTTLKGGVLYNDPTGRTLEPLIYGFLNRSFGDSQSSVRNLASLGVTSSNGVLSFNADRFQAAIAADPAAVQEFFGNATTGFGKIVADALNAVTNRFDGRIQQRADALDTEVVSLQTRIDALTARLATKKTLLQRQFLAMEQALQQVQSQQSTLAQLANNVSLANYSSSSSK